MFEQGFPVELSSVLHKVLGLISTQTYNNVSPGYSEEYKRFEDIKHVGGQISWKRKH